MKSSTSIIIKKRKLNKRKFIPIETLIGIILNVTLDKLFTMNWISYRFWLACLDQPLYRRFYNKEERKASITIKDNFIKTIYPSVVNFITATDECCSKMVPSKIAENVTKLTPNAEEGINSFGKIDIILPNYVIIYKK